MQLQWRDRVVRGASRTFVRCEGDYTEGGEGLTGDDESTFNPLALVALTPNCIDQPSFNCNNPDTSHKPNILCPEAQLFIYIAYSV